MTSKPSRSTKKAKQQGYKVWHFACAVPAIAITLQLMLGSLTPLPKQPPAHVASYLSASHSSDHNNHDRRNRLPEMDILPLNLRGETTGPVLARVIEEYFPDSTEQHATDLRDTMPPCDNPRMIVILSKDDDHKPMF